MDISIPIPTALSIPIPSAINIPFGSSASNDNDKAHHDGDSGKDRSGDKALPTAVPTPLPDFMKVSGPIHPLLHATNSTGISAANNGSQGGGNATVSTAEYINPNDHETGTNWNPDDPYATGTATIDRHSEPTSSDSARETGPDGGQLRLKAESGVMIVVAVIVGCIILLCVGCCTWRCIRKRRARKIQAEMAAMHALQANQP